MLAFGLTGGLLIKGLPLLHKGSSAEIGILELPLQITNVKNEGLAPGKYISGQVEKVVDGDTLKVNYKGKDYTVRLLDVDTPESVKAGVAVQEYAKEASAFTQKQALHKTVKLVFEKQLRDRYNRLLAYVITKEGLFLNAELVRRGYARVEIVKPNDKMKEYFLDLQGEAVRDKQGLWGLAEKKRPFVKNGKGEYVPRYS